MTIYLFIAEKQDPNKKNRFSVHEICRVLRFSRSRFYAPGNIEYS